jgi:hypothetical protein
MSDPKEEFQSSLHRFVQNRQTVTIFPAQVKSVNESVLTCDVEDSDELEIFDVRLRATVDGSDDGFVLVPAVGSWVLIGNIGNSPGEYAVLVASEITKAAFKTGQSTWFVDAGKITAQRGLTVVSVENDGVLIERNAINLKTQIGLLIEQIKLITVTCAAPGAPSTPPINFAAFDAIKIQIDQILK